MQISFVTPAAIGSKSPKGALVLGVVEGKLTATAAKADAEAGGALARGVAAAKFQGRKGQLLELIAPAGFATSRVFLAGLGKDGQFDSAAAELIGASVVGRLMTGGEAAITFALDLPKGSQLNEAAMAAHIALGATLRSYRFDKYRTVSMKDDEPTLKSVSIVAKGAAAAKKAWTELEAVAQGVFTARDLVNEPANILYPEEFAKRAKQLSKLGVKVEVLNGAQMTKLGMHSLMGVSQGSSPEHEARLVVLQWNGGKAKTPPVAFVGKGVCFDTGGLSLKGGGPMMGMKGDMAGAAAVTGLMQALALRKAKVNVVGILGLVENMPDANAQRPNDIVKSMSGQTIEVLNTDAEGRLVLADALWYTQNRFKPKFMVDLATLTGAILIALGTENAGLFSNNDDLSEKLRRAGLAEGEPVWRMPLGDAYDKLLKSKIADMKNIGGQYAGSITGAQFIQRFVNKVPWAHLDIAGVAWQDGEYKPLIPTWGTGWGVRLLNRLVSDNYE